MPWAFLGLLLWLVLPRKRGWPLRLLAFTLLLAALAQPSISRPSEQVAVLVDVSHSVGERAVQAAQRFDFSDLPLAPEFIYFAGDASPVESLAVPVEQLAFLEAQRTDVARALQVASAAGAGRMLLISDGIESRGDALAALPEVPVDVYPLASQVSTRLVRLIAPQEASPGETVQVTAVVTSDREADILLRPRVGNRDLSPIRRTVAAGQTPITFSLLVEEAQDLQVSAILELGAEAPQNDDRQTTIIRVSESQPVLVINDPVMASLLATQGFAVVEGGPADITRPFPYSTVVLRESARLFTPGQLDLLESFVRGGGGLIMTGGTHSFGLGDWHRTPVETVLPVHTDLRTEVELPLVAIVIVLDRSTSMSAERPSRMALARQGALDLVDLAHPDDLIGLITFDSNYEWHFKPQRATDQGKREMLEAITRLTPQGGTIVGPAYREALEVLHETEAAIKHIIILSDGEFFDGRGQLSSGERPDFEAMAAGGLENGITTTTIGIGEADFGTIERMARSGGGRFYAVRDTRELPQIFTKEALTASRSILRDEAFSPRLRAHPLISSFRNVPALEAYIASSLKREGEMLLEGLEGEPVLAISRQGLGRTAALTTDLNAWAGDFGHWADLPALLATVVRWLQASPPQYSASVSAEGGQARLVVDAVQDGQYVNWERLTAHHGAAQVPLVQTAPGRYEALLSDAVNGESVLVVRDNDIVARSAVNLPDPEYNAEGAERLLTEIARRSHGEVWLEPGRYNPPLTPAPVPIWPQLAAAGLLLFMLELVLRRFAGARANT